VNIRHRLEALERERERWDEFKRRYVAAIDKQTDGLTPDELEKWFVVFPQEQTAMLVKIGVAPATLEAITAKLPAVAAELLERAKRRRGWKTTGGHSEHPQSP
jgi:hypothetical protein